MESLYKINLNLEKEYLILIDKLLNIIFSYIFLILLEKNKDIKPLSFLIYILAGNLFYDLVFKRIISFE